LFIGDNYILKGI